MKVLGLEFSSPRRSIALVESDGKRNFLLGEISESDYRRSTPVAQVSQLLNDARVIPGEIQCIAVGLGPGSYTGIRSALAIAQGWQLARTVKVGGVSSARVIAEVAWFSGVRGHVQVVIDAQRNEVYLEDFDLAETVGSRKPLRIENMESWKALKAPVVIGPEVDRWELSGRIIFPTAETVVKLALVKGEFVPAEKLEPVYLRATSFVKAAKPRGVV